jgi:hypothetical protein
MDRFRPRSESRSGHHMSWTASNHWPQKWCLRGLSGQALSEMMVFVRVVEDGSFSSAGRTLSLTPSAISKLITRLKERSGVADETTKVLIREKS